MTLPQIQSDRFLARLFFVLFTCVAVFSVTMAALLSMAGDAQAARADRGYSREAIQRMVIQEANANGTVPAALALAVARVESNFRAGAESGAGARGVMQIMPATAWGEFRVRADRLWDPRVNIRLGVEYLDRLYHQYGRRWELALSHYNGGTLKGGKGARAIPHSFTRKYVAKVMGHWRQFERSRVVLALTDAKPDLKVAESESRGPALSVYDNPDAYWLLEEPHADRNWREYLDAADRILAGKATADDYNVADNERAGQADVYQPFARPGLRERFRNSLRRSNRRLNPVTGGADRFM